MNEGFGTEGSKQLKGVSIFYRLLGALLGIVIVVGGVLSFIFYYSYKSAFEEHLEENILQKYEDISSYFEDNLKEDLIKDLHALSSNPVLDDFIMSSGFEAELNARSVERLFLQAMRYTKTYEGIDFVDFLGQERVKVNRSGRVKQYVEKGENEYFKKIESSPPKAITVHGPFEDADGQYVVSAAVHKVDNDTGEFGGAVIIHYGLGKFFSSLDNVLISGVNPVWVVSPTGKILKKPRTGGSIDPRHHVDHDTYKTVEINKGEFGMIICRDFFMVDNSPIFRLSISLDSAVALRQLHGMTRYFFIVFLCAIALSTFAAFFISRYLTKPITELTRAVGIFAKSGLSQTISINTTGEVGMLVSSFNEMAVDLRKTTVSRDYVDNIVASMINMLLVVSPDGLIIRTNAAACSNLGYEEDELLGKSLDYVVQEEVQGQDTPGMFDALKNGVVVQNMEKTYLSHSGEAIPVLFSAAAMHSSGGEVIGFVCVGQDISEQKKAENDLRQAFTKLKETQEELLRTERLAVVGEASGRVAHEVLNPISSVLCRAELDMGRCDNFSNTLSGIKEILQDWRKEFEAGTLANYLFTENDDGVLYASEDLDICDKLLEDSDLFIQENKNNMQFTLKQVYRIIKIINALRESARVNRSVLEIEICSPIHEALELLEDSLQKRHIKTFIESSVDKELVLVDETEIIQVFANMYRNAMQSIDDTRTRAGTITTNICNNDGMLEIRIKDNGAGIADENQKNIFDSDFTTKDKQHGTGLGLGLSRRLVRNSGGDIVMEQSAVNKGTIFMITLPVSSGPYAS